MFSVCEKLLLICIPRIVDKKQFQIALHANAIITYIYPSRKRPTYNSRMSSTVFMRISYILILETDYYSYNVHTIKYLSYTNY